MSEPQWLVRWPTAGPRVGWNQRAFSYRAQAVQFIYDHPPLDHPQLFERTGGAWKRHEVPAVDEPSNVGPEEVEAAEYAVREATAAGEVPAVDYSLPIVMAAYDRRGRIENAARAVVAYYRHGDVPPMPETFAFHLDALARELEGDVGE